MRATSECKMALERACRLGDGPGAVEALDGASARTKHELLGQAFVIQPRPHAVLQALFEAGVDAPSLWRRQSEP